MLLRQTVDNIDDELIQKLAERMNISKKIGLYKKENNITILQIRRWKKTLKNQLKNGLSLGLDDEFVKLLYQLIHDESIKIQSEEKNSKSIKKNKVA
jgi:chorismate mutase